MPTSMPTRSVATTNAHSANATPWLESAPHPLDAHTDLLIHPEDAPMLSPAELAAIPYHAQTAASAHHEQLSISILLTR
jgi:hypothetical protein